MSERNLSALREALASTGLPMDQVMVVMSDHRCLTTTTIAMTTLNSRLQLALLNRKKAGNLLEKGFTLVELMIVIVIAGALSAAAIPQFLGLKDRAGAGSMIGSMAGYAKECATGQITETAAQIDTTKLGNAGITMTGTCDGSATVAVTFVNAEPFTTGKITGMVCGKDATTGANKEAAATDNVCTLSVAQDGSISGAWSVAGT